jgi:hypothetical protein
VKFGLETDCTCTYMLFVSQKLKVLGQCESLRLCLTVLIYAKIRIGETVFPTVKMLTTTVNSGDSGCISSSHF